MKFCSQNEALMNKHIIICTILSAYFPYIMCNKTILIIGKIYLKNVIHNLSYGVAHFTKWVSNVMYVSIHQ
jgi:hypothetical protein